MDRGNFPEPKYHIHVFAFIFEVFLNDFLFFLYFYQFNPIEPPKIRFSHRSYITRASTPIYKRKFPELRALFSTTPTEKRKDRQVPHATKINLLHGGKKEERRKEEEAGAAAAALHP